MLTNLLAGYCLIAVLMAIWIVADRKSWLTRLPGAGLGSPELDFALAFLWGLFWPVTVVIWMLKPARNSEKTDDHH